MKFYDSNMRAIIYVGQFIDGLKHGEGKQID
jgi:hypothetical protein